MDDFVAAIVRPLCEVHLTGIPIGGRVAQLTENPIQRIGRDIILISVFMYKYIYKQCSFKSHPTGLIL